MKPLRKNVAVAIDGGGIRGVIVTRALAVLEKQLSQNVHNTFRLAVGTSTGSIISAGIGAGLTAEEMTELYIQLGKTIFPRGLRSALFPATHYRYPAEPLKAALERYFGNRKMVDFWIAKPPTDVVITTFDLATNHTRFIKPWKQEYQDWPVTLAVRGSCTVPTYFPVVEGRFVDGGVGSYANPCYLAAYEAQFCLNWDPAESTLISLGTGRTPHKFNPQQADKLWPWQWLSPILGAFLQSADDQQAHLVDTFFQQLDFRRFNVDMAENIEMDEPAQIPQLLRYGDELGRKLLEDETDPIQTLKVPKPTD